MMRTILRLVPKGAMDDPDNLLDMDAPADLVALDCPEGVDEEQAVEVGRKSFDTGREAHRHFLDIARPLFGLGVKP